MAPDKLFRALKRLEAGQMLNQLPSGQWKFGGNKFVPSHVASALPIEQLYVNNRGWGVYGLRAEYKAMITAISEGK